MKAKCCKCGLFKEPAQLFNGNNIEIICVDCSPGGAPVSMTLNGKCFGCIQLENRINALENALTNLVKFHLQEQEGIYLPSPEQWEEAVELAAKVLNEKIK